MYNDSHSHIPGSDQGASLFTGKFKTYQSLSVFTGDTFNFFTTTTTTTTTTGGRLADQLCLRSFIHLSVLPYIVFNIAVLFRSYLVRFLGSRWIRSETLLNSLIINHQTEEQFSKLNYVPA